MEVVVNVSYRGAPAWQLIDCHARIRAASNDAGETSVGAERRRFDPGRRDQVRGPQSQSDWSSLAPLFC